MELLDAVLAFALTLAALATVATIVVESVFRLLRVRGQKLLQGLELALDEEAGEEGGLRLSEGDRKQFLDKVLGNPAYRKRRAGGSNGAEARYPDVIEDGLWRRWRALARCYDKISLEHVAQQLVSLPSVKAFAGESREHLKTGVNRFARRYELACSSVSATYRRRAQLFSMIFGIGLALLANIDGLRIFEVYRNDSAVRSAVIAHEERVRSLADSENGAPIPEEFDDAQDETARLSAAIEWERQRASAALQSLPALRELGVPLGWGRYPACPYGSDDDSAWEDSGPRCVAVWEAMQKRRTEITGLCRDDCDTVVGCVFVSLWRDTGRFLGWLLSVLVTGALIGLGGPFWFDVAKRLAQLRRGINKATASSEDRLSGRNANGVQSTRETIVGEAVDVLG